MIGGVHVRVGIVSWNTADLLDRCLAAIPAALGALEAEVVVVDNASRDESAAVAARHSCCTVLQNADNLGYAKAINQALRHGGDADVLIALNPDTVPPPGSLSTLVERLVAEPTVAVVVPRLASADGSEQHSAYRFPSLRVALTVSFLPMVVLRAGLGRRFWLEGWSAHDRRVDVDWAIGAVHVLRASAMRPKPYDERWFMYAEDLELCWDVAHKGWRVRLEGDVSVVHVGNAAGAQAWGATRTVRWLVPTYEWYALARGARAARTWASVNVVGVSWLRCKWGVLATVWPARYRHLSAWRRDAAAALAVHRRVARHGVRSLAGLADGPPPGRDGPGTVGHSS